MIATHGSASVEEDEYLCREAFVGCTKRRNSKKNHGLNRGRDRASVQNCAAGSVITKLCGKGATAAPKAANSAAAAMQLPGVLETMCFWWQRIITAVAAGGGRSGSRACTTASAPGTPCGRRGCRA